MDSQPLLIFDLDGARFAVDATRVCESVWLPELTPTEEVPPWIVGLFGLRGRIVPVADLHLRFGHPTREYRTSDQVVVLEAGHQPMGLIVSEVIEVTEVPGDAVQPPPQFDTALAGPAHLVAGEARVGDDLVAVLDIDRLSHPSEAPVLAEMPGGPLPDPGRFSPQATPEARALFRARAMALREAASEEETAHAGLAVIELAGEHFGVDLAAVQEFCDINQVSPIPCCPPHILGAMNLHGALVTLIDPRSALNLSTAGEPGSKAVIGLLGEQPVAVAVSQVHDVVYPRSGDVQAPPPALRERGDTEIAGTLPYAGGVMTILDLPALLAREEWLVDENA